MYSTSDENLNGWFLVHTTTEILCTQENTPNRYKDQNSMMIPLKNFWAWNVCKTQVKSIKVKFIDDFGRSDKDHGMKFNAFYRSTIFFYFGIFNGITGIRLINSIFLRKKCIQERRRSEGSITLEMSSGPKWKI